MDKKKKIKKSGVLNLNSQIIKQQSEHYDSYLKIRENPRYKKVRHFILNHFDKKAKVLDIGCADGDFSEKLIKLGFKCYGLETEKEAIKESTSKGIIVKKGSFLEKFPFEDNYFDIVFAGEVIEHTVNDTGFLNETNRVLKKNGMLILTTPNLVSLGNRLLMLFGKLPRFAYSEFHYRVYNEKNIIEKIKNAGFKINKVESSYILISTFFNRTLGLFGERLGTFFPKLGEHLIIYAKKR